MTKFNLEDLASLTNETSAIALINANMAEIAEVGDTLLSRDGTAPNEMLSDLDMNSNQILNLPAPVDDTDPVRLGDIEDFTAENEALLAQTQDAAADAEDSAASAAGYLSSTVELATNALAYANNSQTYALRSAASAAQSAASALTFVLGDSVIDVFTVAGQSNSQGTDADGSLSVIIPSGYVLQYTAGVISDANDPVGSTGDGTYSTHGSAWPSFGLEYFNRTGRRVCFVTCAVGGTAQTAEVALDEGSGTTHWDTGGTLVTQALSRTSAAVTALENLSLTPVVKGVLWCQGEEDAGGIGTSVTTKSRYKQAFMNMLSVFRASYPCLPFYITQTAHPILGMSIYYTQIHDAQQEVTEVDPYSYIAYRGTNDFWLRGMAQGDLHYTQAGYNEKGREVAKFVVSGQDGWLHTTSNVTRLTVTGTPTNGEIPLITFTSTAIPGTPFSVSVTSASVGSGETTTTLAARFATVINTQSNTDLAKLGIQATSIANRVYIYVPTTLWPVPVITRTSSANITLTLATGSASSYGNEKHMYFSDGNVNIGPPSSRNFNKLNIGNTVAVNTDNNVLTLYNNQTTATGGYRVGMLFSATALGDPIPTNYGRTIMALSDTTSGRHHLTFGGYSAGTYGEHLRLTQGGGLTLGSATDPGDGCLYILSTITSGGSVSSGGSATIYSASGAPTGGTAGHGYLMSSIANFGVFHGIDAPTLSAAKGSLYLRTNGSTTNDRMYVNTNGTTGWTAVTTAS